MSTPLRSFIFSTIENGSTNFSVNHAHRGIVNELRQRHDFREEMRAQLRRAILNDFPQLRHLERPAVAFRTTANKKILQLRAEADIGQCSICLNDIASGDQFTRLLCNDDPSLHHMFHTKCINVWFQSDNKTCPMCRCPVLSSTESLA